MAVEWPAIAKRIEDGLTQMMSSLATFPWSAQLLLEDYEALTVDVDLLCARLQQDYPRIRLKAHEAFSGQVEAWVSSGTVDLGLFNRYFPHAPRASLR